MKKFTVITINRNNAEGLRKTIKSVVNQLFADFEYIIIDGMSTDDSVNVILEAKDQIAYWISEKDHGVYHAMNKGIKRAEGEYLIFMNSGDCFASNTVLRDVAATNACTDFIIGDQIMVYKKNTELAERVPEPLTFYHFYRSTIWHQATFTRKAVFDELGGYDDSLKITADWRFILLGIMHYHKSYMVLPIKVALFDTTGISGDGTFALNTIKMEKEEAFITYFPYFYPDYVQYHKYKRFTWKNLKRNFSWRIFILLRKLDFK